ncbi:Resolvase, N-terminal catalytic domain containing protein [uncultured Caudovirales phage]|uniref:Resolvase, N-terminal catalytic domain containing protein n=1 Tax=uncultured Caudovirales phage TaxID=2100421 RepID=A0A6J5NXH3_9CAUD|nr:Resolvase, N-terminal catalytic domain containing protein [uncultured Caudovirales phage]
MKVRGYILVTRCGANFGEQLAAIRAFTNLADDVFSDNADDPRYPRRLGWESLLSASIHGDAVVVGSPGALGYTVAQITESLNTLKERGLMLQDARTGYLVVWDTAVTRSLEFVQQAAREVRQRSAMEARQALAEARRTGAGGVRTGASVSPSIGTRWKDPHDYPSIAELERESGLSRRTLYKRFGPRYARA